MLHPPELSTNISNINLISSISTPFNTPSMEKLATASVASLASAPTAPASAAPAPPNGPLSGPPNDPNEPPSGPNQFTPANYKWGRPGRPTTPEQGLPVTPVLTPPKMAHSQSWSVIESQRMSTTPTAELPPLKAESAPPANSQLPSLAYVKPIYRHQPYPQPHPQPYHQYQYPPSYYQEMHQRQQIPYGYQYQQFRMPPHIQLPIHHAPQQHMYPPPHQQVQFQPPQGPGYYNGYIKDPMTTQFNSIENSRDIKRRTKTGCLTCRKRRIKCDERASTCFNCDKSKRVCLGYDPIFRDTQDKRHRKDEKEPCSEVKTELVETPCSDNDTAHTSPMSNHMSSQDAREKMNISSLLDAAAVIDKKRRHSEDSDTKTKKQRIHNSMEDVPCETWDGVEENFTQHIAKLLDNVFATKRFSSMEIIGKAKFSGLPLDGLGTVIIPAGSDRTGGSGSRGGGRVAGKESSSNTTILIGQSIATLEAVRQTVAVLCPNFYVDNLSIDEGSVGKLEELRVSQDFKLLRAVYQLITLNKQTEFLPVCDKDGIILRRIQALYRFLCFSRQYFHHEMAHQQQESQKMAVEVERFFNTGLHNADENQLWTILEFTAQANTRLKPEQEQMFIDFASGYSGVLRVPLILGAHYYVVSRRLQMVQGREGHLKMLLESISDVLTRRFLSVMH